MNWIANRLRSFDEWPVAVNEIGSVSYAAFVDYVADWQRAIEAWGVVAGDRVALVCDYHISTVALLMALLERACIVVPLSETDREKFPDRIEIAGINKMITVSTGGDIRPETTDYQNMRETETALNPLLEPMVTESRPGFVIFTSGSTGKEKAVLLDYARMVKKYQAGIRSSYRTLLFLKLDHIGGLNTLFSVIFNGGTIVTCASRQASDICACIQHHQVELLPTTPSFLTMMLMSGVYRDYDLSSLKIITYGTEVMPDSTLATLHRTFPDVVLKQTYGLSELGILSTRSKDSSSRWMKIGGEGFEVKVKDDTLWIRSEQAMLGYLNAPSPFDEDGWYNTGDRVEVDGEYFRILGRESEVINVAGEKVFPIEVESFLLTLDNVKDVVVRQKTSPVVGQMIWAEFLLERDEDPATFKKRVMEQCRRHLAPFKVPGLVTIARNDTLVGSRFKKIRKGDAAAGPAQSDVA